MTVTGTTLAERVNDVRAAWEVYQAAATVARSADVPELRWYWDAVRAVQAPVEDSGE